MRYLAAFLLISASGCASKPDAFDFALDAALQQMFAPETLPVQAHQP